MNGSPLIAEPVFDIGPVPITAVLDVPCRPQCVS